MKTLTLEQQVEKLQEDIVELKRWRSFASALLVETDAAKFDRIAARYFPEEEGE